MNANVPNAPELPIELKKLSIDETDQLFAPLNQFSKIALAISGGADSVCLLALFRDWQSRTGWSGKCEVLTVDHGLRPESAREAGFVQDLSARLGYCCTSLTWLDEKPSTGVQKVARQARYRLFADHMSKSGSQALVLAHHKDDQAETFLDRLTRGSGVSGLSAMSADEPNGPEGLRLLRPLLDISKVRLRETLAARGQTWCEDPSNHDIKYKRSRLRKLADLLADEGLTQDRIATTARQMRRVRTALDVILLERFAGLVEDHPAGPARIAMEDYRDQPEEIRLRLLILLIKRVTGGEYSPRLKKIESLDQGILSEDSGRQTLGGAVLETNGKTLWSWKEAGRKPPETIENLQGTGVWDNRFIYDVTPNVADKGISGVVNLGSLVDAPIRRREFSFPDGWPKDAFSCSPVLWSSKGLLSVSSSSVLPNVGTRVEHIVITLKRIPFPPDLTGNYSNDLDGETKV